eukprot:TRINITY_DN2329_c0_g1_i1.p1 TRINITY_DN2329_c0_g1~~TRINITY_DN2329_c0_g1_i1.p1  ORF type:complete len:1084 (+),score=394.47 TRINITY_DN2329_c0_g1_i1:89-3340(+)
MSSEQIEHTPECIEAHLGEALQSRTSSLPSYKNWGPPDMCVLNKQKSTLGSMIFRMEQPIIGYVHWVFGVDVSSAATISVYVTNLLAKQQKASIWGSSSYKVIKASFCVYCAFSKCDIHVEMTFPGGVKEYAMDIEGNKRTVSDELWKEAFLCSVMRYSECIYQVNNLAAVRLVPLGPKATLEKRLFPLISSFFPRAKELGATYSFEEVDYASSPLTRTISKYFMREYRFHDAVDFFRDAVENQPQFAGVLAEVFSQFRANPDSSLKQTMIHAIEIAEAGINADPTCIPMLLTQTKLVIDLVDGTADMSNPDIPQEVLAMALRNVRDAVQINAGHTEAWIALAEVYAMLGAIDLSLIALNVVPMYEEFSGDLFAENGKAIVTAGEGPSEDRAMSSSFYSWSPVDAHDINVGIPRMIGRTNPEGMGVPPWFYENELFKQEDRELYRERMRMAMSALKQRGASSIASSPIRGTGSEGDHGEELVEVRDDDGGDEGAQSSSSSSDQVPQQGSTFGKSVDDDDDDGILLPDKSLRMLDGNFLKGFYRRAYGCLVRILNGIGWDGLMRIRSSVFYMDSEEENGDEAAMVGEESESRESAKEMTPMEGEEEDVHDVTVEPDVEEENAMLEEKHGMDGKTLSTETGDVKDEEGNPTSDGSVAQEEPKSETEKESELKEERVVIEQMEGSEEEIQPSSVNSEESGERTESHEVEAGNMEGSVEQTDESGPLQGLKEAECEGDKVEIDSVVEEEKEENVTTEVKKRPTEADMDEEKKVEGGVDTEPSKAEEVSEEENDANESSLSDVDVNLVPKDIEKEEETKVEAVETMEEGVVEEKEEGKVEKGRKSVRFAEVSDEKEEEEPGKREAADAKEESEETEDKQFRVVKGKGQKRLAARWLDIMFHCMYEDLVALSNWQEEERLVVEQLSGRGKKDEQMGSEGGEDIEQPETTEVYDLLPARHPQDWYWRGCVALRLQRLDDAEMAFRMSIYRGWNIRAALELLDLYSKKGAIKETLVMADQVLRHYSGGETKWEYDGRIIHPKVVHAILTLIVKHGLQSVRDVSNMESNLHPHITATFLQAVENQSCGYDWR